MSFTLLEFERPFRQSWGVDTTCLTVTDLTKWQPENPAYGQCGPTALVVQDLPVSDPIRSATGPAMFTSPRAQAARTWSGSDILVAFPPRACFTVSFFEPEDGTRAAYYVNLELPVARTPQGMECVDLVVDILVRQSPTYRFKDEDKLEFARQAGVYSGDDELFIREAAQEALAVVKEWGYPFGVGLEHFSPDPGWLIPQLLADTRWDFDLRLGRGDNG